MEPAPTALAAGPCCAAGLAGNANAVRATDAACEQCHQGLGGVRPDLVFAFFSSHHVEAAKSVVHAIERRLNPRCILGVSAEGVLGDQVELEGQPGLSLFAAAMPGVTLHPFTTDELPRVKEDVPDSDLLPLREAAGLGRGHRATFLFVDPFSVPVNVMLPLLTRARGIVDPLGTPGLRSDAHQPASALGPILGGMASAGQKPEGNAFILNDRVLRHGGVGLSLFGNIRVNCLVSQGCRPIGPRWVVTGVKGQLVTGLGGKPAIDAFTAVLDSLKSDERELVSKRGIFLGRAVNEYKDRFGRDDFLIRNIYGIDQSSNAIAVMDMLKVGQTVQFHLRDQTTASEDLGMLLDAQRLYERPAGGLLFTCNGRGSRLFDQPNHDTTQVYKAFATLAAGEDKAKMGFPISPRPAPVRNGGQPMPLAGFFAAGEIGPVGDQVFVHGQTACLALFRPASA